MARRSTLSLRAVQRVSISLFRPNTRIPLLTLDSGVEIRGLVRGQADGDDGPRDAAGSAKSKLARHEDVGSVLVFGKQGELYPRSAENYRKCPVLRMWTYVKQDGQGLGIGGQDHELGGTTGQRLGCLVLRR